MTEPVKATWIDDAEAFKRDKVPGSFRVEEDEDFGPSFWYCCPCGCGSISPLMVGVGVKPKESPSWNWNGSKEAATLTPSVNHVGHWHGFLTDGFWRDA